MTSGDGATGLWMASQHNHPQVLRELLLHPDIDVNQGTTDDGSTALFVAARLGNLDIINILLNFNDTDVNKARDGFIV